MSFCLIINFNSVIVWRRCGFLFIKSILVEVRWLFGGNYIDEII